MKKVAIFTLTATAILASAPAMARQHGGRARIFLNWTPMATAKSRRQR